jgi:hypothetical protein
MVVKKCTNQVERIIELLEGNVKIGSWHFAAACKRVCDSPGVSAINGIRPIDRI